MVTRAMTEAGDDEYNDLDELIARYAEPYMRNVEAVTKHRCALRRSARTCTVARGQQTGVYTHCWACCMVRWGCRRRVE